MFVMQLIGRQADTVIDMPFAEAKACMEAGTVRQATQEEIDATLKQSSAPFVPPRDDVLLSGYRMEPAEGGGFVVFDAGGVKISDPEEQPLRNQLEARDFILAHARRARGFPDPAELQGKGAESVAGTGDSYDKYNVEELQKMASDRGLEASGASKKADWVKLLNRDDEIKAAIAARNFDALTLPELKKLAADHNIDLAGKTSKADIVEAVKAGIVEPAV